MPSTILYTMSEDLRELYPRILDTGTQCTGCTKDIAIGDLFMTLGAYRIEALHCGDCMLANYAAKVSHAETALQIAQGELEAIRSEVVRHRSRTRSTVGT